MVVVMRNGRKCRSELRKCEIPNFSAGGKRGENPGYFCRSYLRDHIDAGEYQCPPTASGLWESLRFAWRGKGSKEQLGKTRHARQDVGVRLAAQRFGGAGTGEYAYYTAQPGIGSGLQIERRIAHGHDL